MTRMIKQSNVCFPEFILEAGPFFGKNKKKCNRQTENIKPMAILLVVGGWTEKYDSLTMFFL